MNFYKVSAGRSRFLYFWNKAVEIFPEERYYCSVHVPHPYPNESAGFRLADDTLLDPNVSLFVEICSSNKAILEPLVKLDHLTDLCVVSFNRSTPQVMTLDMVQKCCQMDDENIFYDALLDSTVDGTFFPFEEPLFQKLDEMLGFYSSFKSKVNKVWTNCYGESFTSYFGHERRIPGLTLDDFRTNNLPEIADKYNRSLVCSKTREVVANRVNVLLFLLVIQGRQHFKQKMIELNEQAIKEINVEELIARFQEIKNASTVYRSGDGTAMTLIPNKVTEKKDEPAVKEGAEKDSNDQVEEIFI